ncbi:MAG: alpha/beta hydrolase [Limisphaerales bacterium]
MTSSMRGQGRVVFESPIHSTNLAEDRVVRIYLPPSYETAPRRRYPVLYLHDGQNAFTTAGTNVAFGWGNWALDETVNRLVSETKMREIIMVAVDCSAQRYLDYRGPAYPFTPAEVKAMKRPPRAPDDDARYTRYTRFLIDELKPRIDRDYRTMRGAAQTGLMGSSLGGICSLAMAWEHADVFGNAASLSGAFQVEKKHFLVDVLRAYSGQPKPFRVYLDSGVTDFAGGDDGRKNTAAVVAELRRIGWRDGINLEYFLDANPLTEAELKQAGLRQDKLKEAQTSQHNEFYWRQRAWRPLVLLFPAR